MEYNNKYLSREYIDKLKSYDFYQEDVKSFSKKIDLDNAVLIMGKHRVPPPKVQILLSTYKRPETLKQALKSALDQRGFDDYQIIIGDNECADINEQTETEKLIRRYDDDKIIYYRYKKSARPADMLVGLANSEWIMFLHDDDMIAPYHLNLMTNVVKKYPQITWLSTMLKTFENDEFPGFSDLTGDELTISEVGGKSWIFGNDIGWLGALILRENYINIGGMTSFRTPHADRILQYRYNNNYKNLYRINVHGYYYRLWDRQASIAYGDEFYMYLMINNYYFSMYAADKLRSPFRKIYKNGEKYKLLKMAEMGYGYTRFKPDIKEYKYYAGIPENVKIDSLKAKFFRRTEKELLRIKEKIYSHKKLRLSMDDCNESV